MNLRAYRQKRDFHRTPEPAGGSSTDKSGRRFVVQKHAATRLHYDFRLELDGTLKSWAVPKGPSLDPSVKSLAVHVEDHPLEYANFEGVIPAGEYGGGTVMVWDQGSWTPEGDAARAYRRGKLKFRLDGEKLHGNWTLVRMGGSAGEGGKNWLLMKRDDEFAKSAKRFDVLTRQPLSVVTNRDLDEISRKADRVWHSQGEQENGSAKRPAPTRSRPVRQTPAAKSKRGPRGAARAQRARPADQPATLSPQLATLAAEVPAGSDWLHELKFDGYRILAFVTDGEVRLVTRNGKDWTERFRPVADAVKELPIDKGILDGEVVALNHLGISDFQRLQNAMRRGDVASLVYYVFDLPYLNGYDLTAVPLRERKEILREVVAGGQDASDGPVRFSDHVEGKGATVLAQACDSVLEGIISKRADSSYESMRSGSWLKVKCTQRQEFVIGGFTKPQGKREEFGALLLGYYEGDVLRYCGRVGTGFTRESLRQVRRELQKRRREDSPFASGLTSASRRGALWVNPELVCEVEYTEWTDDGYLRHPAFNGLREDKPPEQITRERAGAKKPAEPPSPSHAKQTPRAPSAKESTVAGVRISHPERIVFPEMGLTKLAIAEYYEAVGPWMLPYIADRPLTLVRCPRGRAHTCFYQKHLAEKAPEGTRSVSIAEKHGERQYIVVDDLQGLIALVQMGALELHPWPARADKIESPDMLIFDLDPGESVPWRGVVAGALAVRERLADLGLETYLRTTGGKGLHVVAPLARRNSWDELKSFARAIAQQLAQERPTEWIANMSKAKRYGKVFIDYLRNQRGATAVANYSTRARPGATVALPITWDELPTLSGADDWDVAHIPARLQEQKRDPWDGFQQQRQSITRAMLRAVGVK